MKSISFINPKELIIQTRRIPLKKDNIDVKTHNDFFNSSLSGLLFLILGKPYKFNTAKPIKKIKMITFIKPILHLSVKNYKLLIKQMARPRQRIELSSSPT